MANKQQACVIPRDAICKPSFVHLPGALLLVVFVFPLFYLKVVLLSFVSGRGVGNQCSICCTISVALALDNKGLRLYNCCDFWLNHFLLSS